MIADVIAADRCPTNGDALTKGGSMVRLINQGRLQAKADNPVIWISPVAETGSPEKTNSGSHLSVTRLPISKQVHDDYYLTVGAARIWMVLHRLPADLPADALDDVPWNNSLEVNRQVADAVLRLAPAGARVTLHDYTLLFAVPEIRRSPDVTLVYVHHLPWPSTCTVADPIARRMLLKMGGGNGVERCCHRLSTSLES